MEGLVEEAPTLQIRTNPYKSVQISLIDLVGSLGLVSVDSLALREAMGSEATRTCLRETLSPPYKKLIALRVCTISTLVGIAGRS